MTENENIDLNPDDFAFTELKSAYKVEEKTIYLVVQPLYIRLRHTIHGFDSMMEAVDKAEKLKTKAKVLGKPPEDIKIYECKQVVW